MGATVTALILGAQSLALAIVGFVAFAGVGVGSTALRVGVGLLFLALALMAGGIALGVADDHPSAGTAALVFEIFAVALAVLWMAPLVAIVSTTALIIAGGIVQRHRRRRAAAASPEGERAAIPV
jgi:hypothetical protein